MISEIKIIQDYYLENEGDINSLTLIIYYIIRNKSGPY